MIFFLIILIGTILRLVNILPYKFYPDAYESLLVAENISKYHSVLHSLGVNGYPFPTFFIWSRPVYPILINIFGAQSASLLAGLVTIILAYFLISRIFKSKTAGLFAAFLTSVSFNHIVWGGFIMTETTGILFMALFLFLFFNNLQSSELLNFKDFLAGSVFSVAVMSRYEYLVIAIPVIYYIFVCTKKPFNKIINLAVSFIFITSIFVSFLFPLNVKLF